MKNLYILLTTVVLLFLISCQKDENDGPKFPEPCGFEKLGDPRDPTEFLSPEKIEMLQNAFKAAEGKSLINQVFELPGKPDGMDTALGKWWMLQEDEIPILIEDIYFGLNIAMVYYDENNVFSTSVSYRLNKDDGTYTPGWFSKNNTEIYFKENQRLLVQDVCEFEVELNDHPKYTKAHVTFLDPVVMAWNHGLGEVFTCEVMFKPQRIQITCQ